METKKDSRVTRILDGILVTVVGGVILTCVTGKYFPQKTDLTDLPPTEENEPATPTIGGYDLDNSSDDLNGAIESGADNDSNSNAASNGFVDLPTPIVRDIEELNGFVVNDFYYERGSFEDKVYMPNEPQNNIEVFFEGDDVTGWCVTIMPPNEGRSVTLTDSYNGGVTFTITSGTFDLQVSFNDGQIDTVYHKLIDITASGTYNIPLENPEQIVLTK